MPGHYARRPRLGTKRHGRRAIVYFAALTGIALAFSAAGPSATATVTAMPAVRAAVPRAFLSELSASPGSGVTVSGSGFRPGSTVRVEIGSKPVTASVALDVGAAGDVKAVLVVPRGSRPGWDDVVLRGDAQDGHLLVEELALQVTSSR